MMLIAASIYACTSPKETKPKATDIQDKTNLLSSTGKPFVIASKFKVNALTDFNIEKWGYEERSSRLIKLSEREIKEFLPDSILKNGSYNQYYYFTVQTNKPNQKSVTIIETDESCCATLHLLTFDKNDHLISHNVVAGAGGDGGWGYKAYGKFLPPSYYQLTVVNEESTDMDSLEEEIEVDSAIITFKVDTQLKFRKISERKYFYLKIYKNAEAK